MPPPSERPTQPYGGYSTTCQMLSTTLPHLQGCTWSRNLDPNFCPGWGLNLGPITWQCSMQPLDHHAPASQGHSQKNILERGWDFGGFHWFLGILLCLLCFYNRNRFVWGFEHRNPPKYAHGVIESQLTYASKYDRNSKFPNARKVQALNLKCLTTK